MKHSPEFTKFVTKHSPLVQKYFAPNGLTYRFSDCGDLILIEPILLTSAKNLNIDGLQIGFEFKENTFEVSEYMAGPKQNELHIFGEFKRLDFALKLLIKLAKGPKPAPVKFWD